MATPTPTPPTPAPAPAPPSQVVGDYVLIKKIGQGSFGVAMLARHVTTKELVVIKQLRLTGLSEVEAVAARRESQLLSSLSHPSIIAHHESFEVDGSTLCIVTEFCARGDLSVYVEQLRGTPMPEQQVIDWFVQISLALLYLHRRKVLHRDLKPANIFIKGDGELALGDLGIAKTLRSTMENAKTVVGTPYYLSPELCQSIPYNHKSDIWACGCVLYELATQRHAFEASSISSLVKKIMKGRVDPLPEGLYSPDLQATVTSMLQLKPSSRPAFVQILQQPYLQPYIRAFVRRMGHKGVSVPHVELVLDMGGVVVQRPLSGGTARESDVPSPPPTVPSPPALALKRPPSPAPAVRATGVIASPLAPPFAAPTSAPPPLRIVPAPPSPSAFLAPSWQSVAAPAWVGGIPPPAGGGAYPLPIAASAAPPPFPSRPSSPCSAPRPARMSGGTEGGAQRVGMTPAAPVLPPPRGGSGGTAAAVAHLPPHARGSIMPLAVFRGGSGAGVVAEPASSVGGGESSSGVGAANTAAVRRPASPSVLANPFAAATGAGSAVAVAPRVYAIRSTTSTSDIAAIAALPSYPLAAVAVAAIAGAAAPPSRPRSSVLADPHFSPPVIKSVPLPPSPTAASKPSTPTSAAGVGAYPPPPPPPRPSSAPRAPPPLSRDAAPLASPAPPPPRPVTRSVPIAAAVAAVAAVAAAAAAGGYRLSEGEDDEEGGEGEEEEELLAKADALLPHGLPLKAYRDVISSAIPATAPAAAVKLRDGALGPALAQTLEALHLTRRKVAGSRPLAFVGRGAKLHGGLIGAGGGGEEAVATQQRDECGGSSSSSSVQKFSCNGETLQGVGVARDPLAYRIECLRAYLGALLGKDALLSLHNDITQARAFDASLDLSRTVRRALGRGHRGLLPLIFQLIHAEEVCFNG